MTRIGSTGLASVAVALLLTANAGAQVAKPAPERQPKQQPATQTAQSPAAAAAVNIGSVRIPKAVSANGQALPAGTYTVRLAGEGVPGKVGQTADLSRWCEFVQGGQVKGKELCTVLSSSEVSSVVKDAPPPAGGSKVQMLKGNDYLRVWINRAGTHYLMHLPAAATN